MNSTYYWICIFGIALGTYAIRASFILFHEKIHLPGFVKRGLPYLSVAILPAIFAPSIFFHQGLSNFFVGHERLVAGLMALFVSFLTRSMITTMVLGYLLMLLFRSY